MGARQFLTAELPACRVDPELKQQVEELARKRDRNVSFVIRAALRDYLAKEASRDHSSVA